MTSINSPGPVSVVTSSTITGIRSRNDGTARIVQPADEAVLPSTDTVQQAPIGVGHDIAVEVDVDLGGAEHHHVNHGGEVPFAVVVVGGEGRGCDVARVGGNVNALRRDQKFARRECIR